MGQLYYCYAAEEAEGMLVQFAGVHVVKWQEHPEYPTVVFVESGYTTEIFDELMAACEVAMTFLEDPEPTLEYSDAVWEQLKAAITNAKGDTDE